MPDDTLAKIIWSFVARAEEHNVDDDPEVVIQRTRANLAAGRYPDGLAAIAEEASVPWPADPAVLDASAWAGKARWALMQRDRAVRLAVADGTSKRAVAGAIGLSPPAIDRILDRSQADNTRW